NARLRRIACSLYFTHTSPTQIYTLSLHDALPIFRKNDSRDGCWSFPIREYGHGRKVLSNRKTRINYWYNHVKYNLWSRVWSACRSEEHTSELQSRFDLVCRLLLEKKNNNALYSKA